MIDDSIESLELRRGIYRSGPTVRYRAHVSDFCIRTNARLAQPPRPTSQVISIPRPGHHGSAVAIGLGLLRISYIRVGENPEDRPPPEGGAWVDDSGGVHRLLH